MREERIEFRFGDVREKRIVTNNHFVSHMVEHIAWRMGLSIDLEWPDDRWKELGRTLGEAIRALPGRGEQGSALGMIDDGSAEVSICRGPAKLELRSVDAVDLAWFRSLRCEQITSGETLVDMLEGLAEGLSATIIVTVWNLEDTHHTWEGIYRGIGVALGKIYTPVDSVRQSTAALLEDKRVERSGGQSEIQILEWGANRAVVRRGTAETGILVELDLDSSDDVRIRLDVDESITVPTANAGVILQRFFGALGASATIDFKATKLSSSHVVMEDIGLVVGRALLEIMKVRMARYGVNGAGSSLTAEPKPGTFAEAGVSVEGRKFWRIVPQSGDTATLRREFLLGQNVLGALRSEDLDDFLDGLSGGMSASIMIHLRDFSDPDRAWQEIFTALGTALREAFTVNPYRRGVPPGVKATLA